MNQPNRIKAAMRAGRKAYGYNLSFPSRGCYGVHTFYLSIATCESAGFSIL